MVAVAPASAANSAPARNDPALADAGAVEAEYWESIKNSTDATDFQEYLKEYPQVATRRWRA